LLVLGGLCCVIELVLMAADAGLIGTPLWRGQAYQNGAFWAGLLYNWRPNYAAQPWLMFITYAFLHSDFWHLAGNMLTLFFLGNIVQDRVGQGGLAWIYTVSAIGGAAAFGLLTFSPQPMVGASGALFGLAGAWLYWEWCDRRREGRSRWPVWRIVFALVVLNALLWAVKGGVLAWETHLGGFVAGWIGAVLLARMGRGGPA
jgi:membrane associated rhomboid family serine protease